MKYRILLSNDDGIDAPGIRAVYEELRKIAHVTVVAPNSERSAAGHAISVFNDLYLEERTENDHVWGYGLDGTPADCVKFAITQLMPKPPHLVVSGINRGQNTGNSILYSGTVAAAMEGAMYGFPSMAVSLAALHPLVPYFDFAAKIARRISLQILEDGGLAGGLLLNVNVPNCKEEEIGGIVITKQGSSKFEDFFKSKGHIKGFPAWQNVGGKMLASPEEEDFDDIILSQNKVSITPLHYDLTHHEHRQKLNNWMTHDLENQFLND